jgi:hypothetical protein
LLGRILRLLQCGEVSQEPLVSQQSQETGKGF